MQSPESSSMDPLTAVPAAGYEFSAEQNKLIANLGATMRDVGTFLVVIGVLQAISGVLAVASLRWRVGTVQLCQGAVGVLIGTWTRSAALHFQKVATTAGADIQHLMLALSQLRQLYSLQRMLIAAVLILGLIALIIALIVEATGI